MPDLILTNGRILTMAGNDGPRRGAAMHELGIIEEGHIVIEDGRIADVSCGAGPDLPRERVVDVRGAVIMPAFVDCHTHACWAGQRFDEFEQRLAGASYLEILKAGGGIMSTVRAVRQSSEDQLVNLLALRLERMAALGTGAVEVKSGYGLQTEAELKMLRAIRRCADRSLNIVTATFLGAHARDPEQPRYVDMTIREMLPAVESAFPGIVCDAYCEEGAWSLDQTRRLFEEARSLGCPLRVHADQFNSLGMTRLAVEMGARSVDHLEAATPDDLEHLARSETLGVALPCSGFHLDDRYAPVRGFVDAGGALAIASNYNPGSAPTPSMPFAIALACRKLRLSPAEAFNAATYNAACVLQLQDEVGSLEPGKRADLQVLDTDDERELAYEFATPGPRLVVLGGKIVHQRAARQT